MSATKIPIQMGMVDEEAKGIVKQELKKKVIFTDAFVDKHTAKNLTEAKENAGYYGHTVTVMNVTLSTALQEQFFVEYESSSLYLAMAAYFDQSGFAGLADLALDQKDHG